MRAPPPNTTLRRLYDALRTGERISVRSITGRVSGRSVADLHDRYGVEVDTAMGRHGGTRMIGQWDGDHFVPVAKIPGAAACA